MHLDCMLMSNRLLDDRCIGTLKVRGKTVCDTNPKLFTCAHGQLINMPAVLVFCFPASRQHGTTLSSQYAACRFVNFQDMSGKHSHPVATRAKLAHRQSPLGVTHAVFTPLESVYQANLLWWAHNLLCLVQQRIGEVRAGDVSTA